MVSTFDTDYILVKEESLENSIKVLSDNNINII
ncbi:MAG: ACT domain-containing protein [Clostridium paraputrificum]